MTKNEQVLEKIVVTAVEAALAYLAVNQTNLSGNAKLTVIGAFGAALSAVYNLVRQAQPTIPEPPKPMNGVTQLTVPKPIPEIPPLNPQVETPAA